MASLDHAGSTAHAPAAPGLAPAALTTLALCTLLPALGTSIANVALPSLGAGFAAPFAQVQWVVLAYLVAVTAASVGAGRLGDRFGQRRLLLGGVALFAAASLACALAPSLGWLVAARAAQGVGAAAMTTLALAAVAAVVPQARIGPVMGLMGTVSAAGTALGPALGGVLLAAAGWRAIFVLNAVLGLATLALAWWQLPMDDVRANGARSRHEAAAMALLAVLLGAYALAFSLGRGQWGVANLCALAVAGGAAWVLLRAERAAATPLLPWALLRTAALGGSLAGSALVSVVMMATLVVGPFHLAWGLHLPALGVGLAMSVGPIVAALVGVPAGRWVARVGSARVATLGLVLMLAGCLLLAAAAGASGAAPRVLAVAGYVLPLAVLAAGYALFQSANNTAVMAGADAARRGVLAGLLNLSRQLGLVSGAAVMGALFAAACGGLEPGEAEGGVVADATALTFLVAAAVIVAALAISRRQGKAARAALA